MKKNILLLMMLFLLQGCVAAYLAGATTGGVAIYKKDNIKSFAADQTIRHKILAATLHNPEFADSHIEVVVYNQTVLLLGETPHDLTRAKVERIAQNTSNAKRVYNQIAISKQASIVAQSHDLWITTSVRSHMMATKDFDDHSIKITTESGVVYLMGSVYKQQAEDAVDIARRIAGVEKVVKVFEYKDA